MTTTGDLDISESKTRPTESERRDTTTAKVSFSLRPLAQLECFSPRPLRSSAASPP